jgi:hypothetical protein
LNRRKKRKTVCPTREGNDVAAADEKESLTYRETSTRIVVPAEATVSVL